MEKIRKLWKQITPYPWHNKHVYFDRDVHPELVELLKNHNITIISSKSKADITIVPSYIGNNKKIIDYDDLYHILSNKDKEIYKHQRQELEHKPLSNESVYFTHDNGGRPFKVFINKKKKYFTVYSNPSNPVWMPLYTDKILWQIPYKKVWIGNDSAIDKNTPIDFFLGNSILFQIEKEKYIFVGESIYSFISENPIQEFVSFVGNSDVPYPFAETKEHYFLFAEQLKLPLSLFPMGVASNHTPYDAFYTTEKARDPKFKKQYKLKISEIKHRLY